MRKLWTSNNWNEYISEKSRPGIRLKFDKNVDPEVKRACKQYVNWLRTQYYFPIRVPIYFKSSCEIISCAGEKASASFFGPFDIKNEPFIRVAVGDYYDLLNRSGKDDALAVILVSITHELTHYFQWIKHHDEWCYADDILNNYYERQALYYANVIFYSDYANVVDHP